MSADIVTAKKELYSQLKIHEEVTGAGIREKNGSEFIVIVLSKTNNKVLGLIPPVYKGNKVKTEIRSIAKAM
jgi:hypothetical protein